MSKNILKFLLKLNLLGTKRTFKFFQSLHRISLKGMNIGLGGEVKESGELNVLKYVKKQYKNSKEIILFDVGANIGKYSKTILQIFNIMDIKLHCFEPSLKTFEALQKNLPIHSNICLNNFGLSDSEQEKEIFQDKELSGITSLYNRKLDHFGITFSKVGESLFKTLEQYCCENKIDKINFLKLDVEGHELNVLKGGQHFLPKIDFIQFEFGGCNIDSRTYFQDFYYLLKDNFDLFYVLKNSIVKVNGYKELYEIFLTTNFLCVNKKMKCI